MMAVLAACTGGRHCSCAPLACSIVLEKPSHSSSSLQKELGHQVGLNKPVTLTILI